MNNTIRIGLIGAGGNTRAKHIPEFLAIPDVEIVAIANRTNESAEAVSSAFNLSARVTVDPLDMIPTLMPSVSEPGRTCIVTSQ